VSIFKRISDVVRSNVNSALDAAEDPRKVLEQTILDMEGEHKKARQKLLESMTLLKQTEKQAETLRKQAVDWETKAMAALKAGNEDLARSALSEKQKTDALAAEAEAGVAAQQGSNEQLKQQISALEQKIKEAKSKKDELIARLNAADMKKKQATIASGGGGSAVNDATAFDTFDRMVAKIENSEAEVEARQELMGSAPEVDTQLKKITEEQSGNDALAALKAKMAATGAPPPAAAAAPATASGIDDELAKLKAKLGG
jgi:phage shock protein A